MKFTLFSDRSCGDLCNNEMLFIFMADTQKLSFSDRKRFVRKTLFEHITALLCDKSHIK